MNCYKCGAIVPEGTKYCTNCGADLIIDQSYKANSSFASGGGSNKLFEEEQKAEQANNQEPYLAGNDKTLIALLCFFLGGLGVHCFVMGETRKGIIRIVFSLLCGIGAIFALIDFIMILSDTYVVNPDAYFFK